jgi:hypothetical protein
MVVSYVTALHLQRDLLFRLRSSNIGGALDRRQCKLDHAFARRDPFGARPHRRRVAGERRQIAVQDV